MMNNKADDDHWDPAVDGRDDAVVGQAFKWSMVVISLAGVVAAVTIYLLTRPAPAPAVQESELATVEIREAPEVQPPQIRFTDITQAAGIEFTHENGARGDKLLPETMGGGCAFFDFDMDGDQDLLFINSENWADTESDPPPQMALYRNDGQGTFEDVTSGSGLDISCYGMGVAVGDYDNDGRDDLFLSALGTNRLFHNEGDGKFLEVTQDTGIGGDPAEWSTSCGWFDFDRDGDLDLFVCNYVQWSREFDLAQDFQLTGGDRAYGRPQNFEGTFPYLYRNDGDGRFEEIGEAAGLHLRNPATGVPMAKSLGITFADFDGDQWLDVVVGNDTVQNFLFHNRQDGTFEEIGMLSGVAFDMNGAARGAMGIDAAQFRNNEAMGIAIGNFSNEMTALYVSPGKTMQFMDEAISSGLGPNTRLALTFGVCFVDCDLDGRLDLIAANGHLEQDINRVQPSQFYEQPPQLFWNCGPQADAEFLPLPVNATGEEFAKPLVGRGASYADIDADGDVDVLITTTGRRPRLLRNDQQLGNHWLRLQLEGTQCQRNGIGAWVEVTTGETTLRRQVMPTRSYLSQVEFPITFGLGPSDAVSNIKILWPDGTKQELSNLEVDRAHTIRQSVE